MVRRDLTSDDVKVWRFVTRHVAPLRDGMLHDVHRHPADESEPDTKPVRAAAAVPSPAPVPRPSAPLKVGAVADIDRRTANRFKKGEMAVDGRIDLHGLTLDQAHGALTSYLRVAAARGARCVIVITGKGKGDGIGKIRGEVPHWLNQQPLRALILAVTQARIQHGGTGAFYVLLKRRRES